MSKRLRQTAQKGQYMKMCSTFLIREMKIKLTARGRPLYTYHNGKQKKTDNSKCWQSYWNSRVLVVRRAHIVIILENSLVAFPGGYFMLLAFIKMKGLVFRLLLP